LTASQKVRWGIVGLGQIAYDKFLPGLLLVEGAECVAFADTSVERRELFASVVPSAKLFGSLDELLASQSIDVLYISLPTGLHREAVLAAAKAGVHILCEKPLATSFEDAEAMTKACKEANVRLMTAYMSRFGDVYTEALRIIRGGEIGKIVFAEAHFAYDARQAYPLGSAGAWRWTDQVGGGPMLDIGIYLLFALREMLGSNIFPQAWHRSEALESTLIDSSDPLDLLYTQPDTHTALFQAYTGTPGILVAAFTHNEVRITLFGTDGKITLTDLFSQKPTGKLVAHTKSGMISMDAEDKNYPHFEHYFREAQHFTNAILESTPHLPSADDALSDMAVISAFLS
jgi:glucose-fructose oxidoreductase